MAAKFGVAWSSAEKSHWNGRIEEVSEFHLRYYCKTKINRRSGHYLGTFWPNTGIANEINCKSDSKEFQDAESIRSGNSHVTSRPVSFPPPSFPEGMLSRSFGVPSRREGPPSIWDTHGISGNVFANPDASSSAPYPQELNQWNSSIEEPLHSSTVEKSERQKQDQDLRCQSGPSAKNSVIPSEGDQQRLQISDLHFDKFPTPATFACWKIRFKTAVCTCSQFCYGSYAMDQRSGDGLFSGWFKVFVIYTWYFNAEFWSTWCEDCFSAEQNHP